MRFHIFLLFLFFQTLVNSQDLTVIYKATPKPNEMLVAERPLAAMDIKTYMYSLTIKDGKSKYSRDSVLVTNVSSNLNEYWCYQNIYKDYKNDLWIKSSGRYIDNAAYMRSILKLTENNHFSWVESGRSAEILGIECIEVKHKDKTAWYAPSMPISDGPLYGIFGLKGLVLKNETSNAFVSPLHGLGRYNHFLDSARHQFSIKICELLLSR